MAMDDSTSILDALAAQLTPDTIQKMSTQLGTDTAATSNAISMAVPILLGSLSKNAANAEGAAALDDALAAHDGGILGNLGAFLGGGGGAGAAILAHILGSRRTPVEQGVGRATGMNAQQVAGLLTMLAPLVMGVLGRMKRQQNVGAKQLPEVLGQANLDMARQSPAIGDLSRILDRDNDGEIADDVARIGSSILGGLFGQGAKS
ncbi:MAG: DUF937 domain-containing protein [Thermoanaerobaculia bacterium]